MEKILVLQLNRLGDLVQTVPLLKRLRTEKPSAEITLVCLSGPHGILAGCGHFDRLVALSQIDVDRLSEEGNRAAFPDLAPFDAHPEFRETYDLAVNLTSDLGSSVINEKIAAARKLGRIHTFAGELRLLGPWAKYLFAMVSHRVDNLFNLVDIQMGIAGLRPDPEPASLSVSEAGRAEAAALLASHGRKGGRRLIGLQTGASQLQRAWSVENFAALAKRLSEDGYADILLLGDANERERAEVLQSQVGSPVLDLVGRTSLAQLPAILEACDLLVSNDTGTIHIAAAVGTTALGLYFSTAYFSETAPYGDGHAVLQVEIPCAPCHATARCPVQLCREYLTVDAVHASARWLLDGSPEPPSSPNLALYRSRFLANGSLIYMPVHAQASSHYPAGLLGRLLWEGALGLSGDPSLESLWIRLRGRPEWARKCAALFSTLAALSAPFDQGLNLAGKLRAEFAGGAPSRERILMLHQQLAGLGAAMDASSREGSLFGDFLRYEMMDMDYAKYPELAGILEEKYRMLSDWCGRFRETLVRLTAS